MEGGGWRPLPGWRGGGWQPLRDSPSTNSRMRHVVWLHVPKSGSGFANLLFRAACGATTRQPFLEPIQVACVCRDYCPGAFRQFDWGHASLQQPLLASTMVVTLMRSPWRRALSGFFANLHSCTWLQQLHNVSEHQRSASAAFYRTFSDSDVRAYAVCADGCASRMLTGRPCGLGPHNAGAAQTAALVPRANATLHLATFVGVTDEWNRTLRVFSQIFQTPLADSDAAIQRQGPRPGPVYERVASLLRGRRFADDTLFIAARRILDAEERGEWPNALRSEHAGRQGDGDNAMNVRSSSSGTMHLTDSLGRTLRYRFVSG